MPSAHGSHTCDTHFLFKVALALSTDHRRPWIEHLLKHELLLLHARRQVLVAHGSLNFTLANLHLSLGADQVLLIGDLLQIHHFFLALL